MKSASRACRKVGRAASKHAPQLLAGASLVTGIGTIYFAIKGTVVSVRELDEYKQINNVEKVPFKDAVKICGKHYIPAALTGTTTVGLKVGGIVASNNQTKAWKTAYKIAETGRLASETALLELKEATKTVVGEEAAKQIEEKITENKSEQLPATVPETPSLKDAWVRSGGKSRVYIPFIDSSPEAVPYDRFASTTELYTALAKLKSMLSSGYERFVSLENYMDILDWRSPEVAAEEWWDETDDINIKLGSVLTDDGELLIELKFSPNPQELFAKTANDY